MHTFQSLATWVGGVFINGTAEHVATPGYGYGLLWCTFPFSGALALICGMSSLLYVGIGNLMPD